MNIEAVFSRAPLDKENGTQLLKPGNYFIDTDSKDLFKLNDYNGVMQSQFVEALSFFPKEDIGQILNSGRGQTMISFNVKEETIAPNNVLQSTGFFYELPPGVSLAGAQRQLYGDIYDEPRGFFEWLASENPAALKHMISFSEGVVATGKSVLTNTGDIAKAVLYAGGAIVTVLVLFKLLKKGG